MESRNPPVIEALRLFNGEILVTVVGLPLNPVRSQQVRNHNPGGFNWGYDGSGSLQLALALRLKAGPPDEVAERHCQTFK